jgi:hypothetical protein
MQPPEPDCCLGVPVKHAGNHQRLGGFATKNAYISLTYAISKNCRKGGVAVDFQNTAKTASLDGQGGL